MRRQNLTIIVNPHTYQRLQREIGSGKISRFVEELIIEGLDNHEKKLTTEQKDFQKKLIAGYKRSARSKSLKKEDEIWDEVVGEGIE
jgi:hypothetical protein